MSDDPETARQIAELARDDRPLIALDVDEVVLEFLQPLAFFLEAQGLDLKVKSFHLHGNVFDRRSGEALADERVSAMMEEFFLVQDEWQTAAEGAADALAPLAGSAEIVMLTAMPHRHRARRRALLDRLGFPYPLVTTERAKGPAIRQLRGSQTRPVAFVDDLANNLISVRTSVADAHLFHLMAHSGFRALMPPLPAGIEPMKDWREAGPRIAAALGI